MATVSAPLTLRSFRFWLYQYKRTWRGTLVSTVLFPVLFLASMGLGLGSLVDSSASGGVADLPYLVFLAPGLLAATAMQTGAGESTYAVIGSIKWVRTYHAMLATPLGVLDVLFGHLLWVAFRVLTTSAVFLAVMTVFGAVRSPLALLALPAALLVGMAFSAPMFAFAATTETDAGFAAIQRFVITPLFLFGGVFFPVAQLPPVLEQVAYVTPLWHGVQLSRDLSLGTGTALGALGHAAYLVLWIAAGCWLAAAAFLRRLAQ